MRKKQIEALCLWLLLGAILAACGGKCAHANTKIVNSGAPTCQTEGVTGDTVCVDCGEVLKKSTRTPMTDHTPVVEGAVNATCTQPGNTGRELCSVCGKTLRENAVIEPLGHWETLLGAKEATCQADGYSGDAVCGDCGEMIAPGQVIPAGEHIVELRNYAPNTCTEDGYSGDAYCSTCGKLLQEGEVLSGSHARETRNAAEATCLAEGYSGDIFCYVCSEQLETGKKLPKTDHTPEAQNAVAATCAEAGYSGDMVCKVCGAKIAQGKTLPALNHANTEIRNAAEATASAEGYTGDTYCADCGKLLKSGDTIPKKAAPASAASYSGISSLEQSLFNDMNNARAAAGLSPLIWEGGLSSGALIRANEYRTRFWEKTPGDAHQRLDGRSYTSILEETGFRVNYSWVGENLVGHSYSEELFNTWMGSAPHKAAILDPDFTHAAVAAIYDGTVYFACTLFWG